MPRKKRDNKLPLLLGESPSKSGDRYWMFPLSGRVAQTMCELAGIPPQADGSRYGRWTWALYDNFECANLFERYADATPWHRGSATAAFGRFMHEHVPDIVVCLGRKAQTAAHDHFNGHLAFGGDNFYDWNIAERIDGTLIDLVTIPHPSGLNRLLNDPEERESIGRTLRLAMRMAVEAGA